MKYIRENTKFNIDLVYKHIAPKNRNSDYENQRYKAYIFSYLIGCMFSYKTVHNYKSGDKRRSIMESMEISERTFHRYLKNALEFGFVYIDPYNENNLKVSGIGTLIDRFAPQGEESSEEDKVLTFYKARLRFKSLSFKNTMMLMDVALLRYYEYIESIKKALSMGRHIHKAFKKINNKKTFLLSYEDKRLQGKSPVAKVLSDVHFILNDKKIENIVYTNNSKEVHGDYPFVDKQIYGKTLTKSFNSALISIYEYFSIVNIDSIYLGDGGSKFRGEALGYSKSGLNHFLDRAEKEGYLTRTAKYAVLGTASHERYRNLRATLKKYQRYNSTADEGNTNFVLDRIVYKHGFILFQRENHIKVNSQAIKFPWDKYSYHKLVDENADVMSNKRYPILEKKLGIDGVTFKDDYDKKVDSAIAFNSVDKIKVIDDEGKTYNSLTAITVGKEVELKGLKRTLMKKGEISVEGRIYKLYNKKAEKPTCLERQYGDNL